jgi:D-methionine transport system substrate-binding protein
VAGRGIVDPDQGHLDANFFQYLPFLDDFNRRHRTSLVPIVPVHIEPFGLYARPIDSLNAIPDYAEIALPSDPVNVTRSLAMLDDLGLVECPVPLDTLATISDVRSNPYGLFRKGLGGRHRLSVCWRQDYFALIATLCRSGHGLCRG